MTTRRQAPFPATFLGPSSRRAIAVVLGILVAGGGGLIMATHLLRIAPAQDVSWPVTAGTVFNTGFSFLLLGVALVLAAADRGAVLVQVLAAAVLLVAGASLVQVVSGVALGIDLLFWRPATGGDTSPAVRMAPITAYALVVLASALLALSRWKGARSATLVALLGASAVCVVVGIDLLARLAEVPPDSRFPNPPQLPLMSSQILVLASVAVAVLSPGRSEGILVRLRHALGVGILVVLAGTVLTHLARGQERAQAKATLAARASGTSVSAQRMVVDAYQAVQIAAVAAAVPGIDERAWRSIVSPAIAGEAGHLRILIRGVGAGAVWEVGQLSGPPGVPVPWRDPQAAMQLRTEPDLSARWPRPIVLEVGVLRDEEAVATARLEWDAHASLEAMIAVLQLEQHAVDVRFGAASLYRNAAAEEPPPPDWLEERILAGTTTAVVLRLWPTAAALAGQRSGLPILTQVATTAVGILIALGLHILGVSRRRTRELEAVQAALAVSEARMRDAERLQAVGQLAGGVAHEFNNLLTSIRGYASLASDAAPAGSLIRSDLSEVLAATDRAADLTGRLLAVGQRQLLLPERVDLGSVVVGTVERLREHLSDRLRITVSDTRSSAAVYADPRRVDELLGHVITNAAQVTPEGGEVTIAFGVHEGPLREDEARPSRPAGLYPWVEVRDTGPGLDAGFTSRLLEPFGAPVANSGRVGGLGLPAVFGIVAQSGGALAIRSVPGRGTTVRVYLPAATGDDAPHSAAVAEHMPEPVPAPIILVVEDEPAIRQLATRVLRANGYDVRAAGDAGEALALVDRLPVPPALVISDVLMPGIPGDQLMEQIRERAPAAQTLFISGFAADQLSSQGVALRSAAFLQKPFTTKDLLGKVRQLLKSADGAGLP